MTSSILPEKPNKSAFVFDWIDRVITRAKEEFLEWADRFAPKEKEEKKNG